MSKNLIFAQKMTKLWACQISQNKKNTLYNEMAQLSSRKREKMFGRIDSGFEFVKLIKGHSNNM
jgi:hypothetical protein